VRILMVTTELWPIAKVGGLGDVVASLSRALRGLGHDVRCALPAYAQLDRTLPASARVVGERSIRLTLGTAPTRVEVRWVESDDLPVPLLLFGHELLRREGIYDDPATHQGYPDNGVRWALFCRAVHAALGLDGWAPDVVHGHDHQAGPLMGLLRWSGRPPALSRTPATVFTIHNVGYQGIEPPSWIADAGLPATLHFPLGPLEFHNNVNLMKIGIRAADRITTVSPRYAGEIRADAEFGMGLEDDLALRAERLTGILNGIDTEAWDPRTDPHLRHPYSLDALIGKSRNRAALRAEMGLRASSVPAPLLAMVTRLATQKGLDLMLPLMEAILDTGMQIVVLGSGEQRYEIELRRLAERRGGRMAVRIGFDEPLAHRIEAGADIFAMPSRYEPCGLNQMYSLRYGTVPVVRAVGGLADTVIDLDEDPGRANGFVFRLWEQVELFKTIHRAGRAWRNRKLWRELMHRGMTADFSWTRSARAYVRVYERALSDSDLGLAAG
jgi:starch synthase